MFDIGFWELILLAIVTLVVVGPERLPRLARTAGLWMGKARRMVSEVKSEVERELQIEEIKQSINRQGNVEEFRQLADRVKNINSDLKNIESDLNAGKPAGDKTARVPSDASPGPSSKPPDE